MGGCERVDGKMCGLRRVYTYRLIGQLSTVIDVYID